MDHYYVTLGVGPTLNKGGGDQSNKTFLKWLMIYRTEGACVVDIIVVDCHQHLDHLWSL